ncbi:MAG: SDR family NAD(P)-dependent oxidoreductase [Mycobacterium sp.]|nr:SDR family NAD(P)-dependent oxidoreductase [Mycobacterium sp.]
MKLQGKFAVVTGGGSGIGLAITRALRAAGSDVLIVGRNETRLQDARGDDSRILTLAADVTDRDDRSRLIDRLSDGRPVDILINNAGSMTRIDLHEPNAQSLIDDEVALALVNGKNELRIGQAKFLYPLSRVVPNRIYAIMNGAFETRALVK